MQSVDHDHNSAVLKKDRPKSAYPVPTVPPADLREGAHWLAGRQEVPFFPPIVYIEPTNVCNCNCVICPRRFMSRAMGFMPMDLFQRIIEQVSAVGPSEIRLFNFGEPLLHPKLCDMIASCRKKNLPVHFQTNGVHLAEPIIRRLLATGLDYLGVSVNGLTSAEYEMIRPGFLLSAVQDNVRRVRSIAAEIGARVHIHVNAQILKSEKDRRMQDIETYVRSWSSLADSLSISGLSFFQGIAYPAGGRLLEADLEKLPRRADPQVCCIEPFDRVVIKWDGRVTACCADYDARFVVGDLNTQRLSDIWNSPRMNLLRTTVRERRYFVMPHCRSCPRFYSDEFTVLFKRK